MLRVSADPASVSCQVSVWSSPKGVSATGFTHLPWQVFLSGFLKNEVLWQHLIFFFLVFSGGEILFIRVSERHRICLRGLIVDN